MGPELVLGVSPTDFLLWIACAAVGAGVCWGILHLLGASRRTTARRAAEAILEEARREATAITKDAEVQAKAEYIRRQEQFEEETAETRKELKELEKRLSRREDGIDRKLEVLNTKERNLNSQEHALTEREKALRVKEKRVDETLVEQRDRLLKIAGMGMEEAKALLLATIEKETEHDAAVIVERILTEARDAAQEKARDIIITAIQRYAADHTSDSTVSTVDIPSDDMKGRVIGREGRNIRAFEKATGVDVIVDDTPGVVVVSAFDPVRREIARQSLERLIQDGRIHPARIEEIVAEIKIKVDNEIMELGKKAGIEANVGGLHRRQLDLLGRLHFRTSYGQNVLAHSIEVAYLCQIMAEELGLDGALARRCGLLHDIGKAVDHEVEGAHPQIGADICRRFKEPPEVVNAAAAHHGDVEATSPYTPLVAAADAISASRPGGRRESLERYIKRLEALEELAMSFAGVKQAYAVQAGREIRVIVDAERVDDKMSFKLARDIAKRIEEETTYPGEVKVTLLREIRAVEYAR